MTVTVIIHIVNDEPIVCDLDELPDLREHAILLNNPRMRDGKEVPYLEEEVSGMILPWHRINFVQVLLSAETEDVIGFVRD